MRIGIIGSGTMGRTLGELWAKTGHDILFGSRDPQHVAQWLASSGVAARHGTYAEAAGFGDVVLLATLWHDTQAAIEEAGAFDGKLLIDCTNPELSNPYRLAIGHTTSGAEAIAGWAKGAKVVKTFNHIYGSMLRAGATFGEQRASIFYCGDDETAKQLVAQLAVEVGLDPIDAGPLLSARYLEPLAGLWVQLVGGIKWDGEKIGLRFLRRES